MSENCRKQHREPCVLFLDDAFCSDQVVKPLVKAGYCVEQFTTYFPESPGSQHRAQDVKDKLVIELCHKKKWLIVTRDLNMRITHVEVIKKNPNAMILATASNSKGDLASWVDALIAAKHVVEVKVRRQGRPWYGQFDRQGNVTVCKTIDCTAFTRRSRPREQ